MWRTEEADRASRLAWRAAAMHEARAAARLGLESSYAGQESSLALESIAEIVTVCEMATTESLLVLADQIIGGAAKPVRAIAWSSAQQDAEGTWQSRKDFVKRWVDLTWNETAWFRAWLGYVEARNAWAHGHGVLTRKQLTRSDLSALLKAAGLSRSGNTVLATRGDVRACVGIANELLHAVDDAVASGHG